MSEWIRTADREPEIGAEVQVYRSDSAEQMVAMRRHDGTYQFATCRNEWGQQVAICCRPTHWAELRESPE